jgi:hypothetical protein
MRPRLSQTMLALCLVTSLMLPATRTLGVEPGNNPIQGMHQDIVSEMEEVEPEILPHVDLLWRHTLQRSPTLQLALQKMAEKTGQVKVRDRSTWTGQMLQGIVQLGGIGGAVMMGSPAPIIGSAVVGRMTAPDTVPAQLTQVTSADLVILTREIEDAQSHLIINYLQYRQALAEQDKIREDLAELKNQSNSSRFAPGDRYLEYPSGQSGPEASAGTTCGADIPESSGPDCR